MGLRDFIMGRKNSTRVATVAAVIKALGTQDHAGGNHPPPYLLPPMKHLKGRSPAAFNREWGWRRDVLGRRRGAGRSKYQPHQGIKECARRRAKLPWWVRAESSIILDPMKIHELPRERW